MAFLLFKHNDLDLTFSEITEDGDIRILMENHAEDATNVHAEVVISVGEMKILQGWLNEQSYKYEKSLKGKTPS